MILSKELAVSCLVFCPKLTNPAPVIKVIGLTLLAYKVSLSPSFNAIDLNSPSLVITPVELAFVIPPRLVPAGANHGNDT